MRSVAAFAAVLVVILSAVFLLQNCRKPEKPNGFVVEMAQQPFASTPTDNATSYAAYAGSESCRDCHEEAYQEWSSSNHALAERHFRSEDQVAFDPSRRFEHGSQHTQTTYANGKYQVVALGPSGQYETLALDRVIGNDPLRQFLVPFPGGRFQALEASYDPHRNEWFNVYGNEDRKPSEWGHWSGRGMNWNSMCAVCHNTRLHKNYDERNDTYATSMAEMSVGCEACHGPMKQHVEWQVANPDKFDSDPTLRTFTPQQSLDTCGSCHSRRMEITGDFVPGDSFFDHYSLNTVDESNIYYPDGQVREENYEFAAFLGSRMGFKGVRCIDCHMPHTGRLRLSGNMLCMRCHYGATPDVPVIDPVTHSFHKVDPLYLTQNGIDLIALSNRNPDDVVKSGSECVNCHMPQTNYMQRHRRHDHGFTIPDPLLTKQFGIPNACNRCHTDKDVDWAISWTEKWYGDRMNRPRRTRAQTLAAARKGDGASRDQLIAMLSGDEAPYWKAVAATMLARWAFEPEVTAALLGVANHESPLVRESVVSSLAGAASSSGSFADAWQGLLDDPSRNVRVRAAWVMRERLDPKAPAAKELIRTLDLNSDQPTGQLQKGAYALARGDVEMAARHYRKAIDWDSNSAPIHHDYAIVLSTLQKNEDALEHLKKACSLEPNEPEYQFKLALAYNELGDLNGAIRALKITVRLDPKHGRAWYNLALALNAAGKSEEALSALNNAALVNPTDPSVPYARATICAQLGQLDEAKTAASAALKIDPDFAPARNLLEQIPE